LQNVTILNDTSIEGERITSLKNPGIFMSFETDSNGGSGSQEADQKEALIEEIKRSLEQLLLAGHLSEDEKASVIHQALQIIVSNDEKGEVQ
jgi:hypothetical protein